MKTTPLLLAPFLGLAFFLETARAEDPAPAAPAPAPDLQAMLGELSKLAGGTKSKEDQGLDLQALFAVMLKLMTSATTTKDGSTPDLQATFTELLKSVSGATTKNGQSLDLQDMLGDLLKPAPGAAAKDGQAADLQTQLAELLKSISKMIPSEEVPAPDPAGTATAPAAAAAAAPTGPKVGLTTHSLSSGSLAPSGSVNGRGTVGAQRLNEGEWRALFPARDDRR